MILILIQWNKSHAVCHAWVSQGRHWDEQSTWFTQWLLTINQRPPGQDKHDYMSRDYMKYETWWWHDYSCKANYWFQMMILVISCVTVAMTYSHTGRNAVSIHEEDLWISREKCWKVNQQKLYRLSNYEIYKWLTRSTHCQCTNICPCDK